MKTVRETPKTVASVSFHDNRSVTMDVEDVTRIELGTPMEVEDGSWFCELIVRAADGGFVAIQMLSKAPEKFRIYSDTRFGEDL